MLLDHKLQRKLVNIDKVPTRLLESFNFFPKIKKMDMKILKFQNLWKSMILESLSIPIGFLKGPKSYNNF